MGNTCEQLINFSVYYTTLEIAWELIFAFETVYIALGLLLSLQPPFFPSEAEKKGAKPAEYGFVFGIANLSLFFFR